MIRERFAIVARFFVALGLSLWLGGMAFFGAIVAPVLFRTARAHQVPAIAPEMVGLMLARFAWLTYLCGAFLVLGWLVDGAYSRDRGLLWKLQGAGSIVALGMGLYLGRVLLPQTIAQQDTILPIYARDARHETLTPQEKAERARFDAGHKAYQQIASVNVWLLLGLLGLLMARTTTSSPRREMVFAEREESPQT